MHHVLKTVTTSYVAIMVAASVNDNATNDGTAIVMKR